MTPSFRDAPLGASPESIRRERAYREDWSTTFFEPTAICGYGFPGAQLRTIASRCAAPRNDRRPALRGPSETLSINRLAKISAEALDALASVLEVGGLGRIGDAERRSKTEGRALHHCDAFGFQKLGDKVLVIGEHLAGR